MATPRRNPASAGTGRTAEQNKRLTIFIICAILAVALLVGIIFGLIALFREPVDDGRILPNVTAGGVNIGGMTQEEATNALQVSVADPISRKDLKVELPGATLTLAAQDAKVKLDLEALVQAAYRYGRTGSALEKKQIRAKAETTPYILPLLPYLELDQEYIRTTTQAFCDSYSINMSHPTAVVTGDRPTYTPPDKDGVPSIENDKVTHQVLTIVTGTPQFLLESDDVVDAILDAYSLFDLTIQYEAPKRIEPEKLDLQELFDTYCQEPVDAEMDEKTFQITPEVVGYGFDIAFLQELLDKAGYGQEVKISFSFLLPDITERSFGELFQDVLATFTATAKDEDQNQNRDNNLLVSCEAINGTVVKPGEVFDFNKVLGPRTSEKGYVSAPTYTDSSINSIGGGISQTASALHYCAMLAGLQINERHAHPYTVPYTPLGTDAAITYGKENLVFTNTTAEPIRILAKAEGDQVTIQLLGTESRTYKPMIEADIMKSTEPTTTYQYMAKDNVMGYKDGQILQKGHTGYTIQVYYCRYDEKTNDLIGRDLLYEIRYAKVDQVVAKVESDIPDPTDPTGPSGSTGSTAPTGSSAKPNP